MANEKMIDLKGLSESAAQLDGELRELPSVLLEPVATALHLNLVETDRDLRRVLLRRRGGLLRPYRGTVSQVEEAGALRAEESVLRLRAGYMALEDNVMNYQGVDLRMDGGRLVDHQRKEHPLAYEVLRSAVRTFVEDVALAVAHARYGAGDSPLGAFDGYNALVDAMIADGRVSKAQGNLLECGPMAAPQDDADTAALESLVGWLRSLHPALRAGELDVLIPSDALQHVLDAYERKRRWTGELSLGALQEYLRVKAGISGPLSLLSHPVVGQGTRLIACRRGTITVGLSCRADTQFVQVRAPYTDPNVVQFWMQAHFGTRIEDWHAKVFTTNGGLITPTMLLYGDYAAVAGQGGN